jgi:uroporphyrinogen decarboxylase
MDAITNHRVAVIHKVAEHFRPDVICNMDDYGTHHGPLMSRETFREFILPYGKRVADAIKGHGILYMHHSCGTFDALLDDMVEMGVQAITAVAPSNDVDGIIAKYGDRLVYDGGMNIIGVLDRPDATEAEKRAEVRRAADKFGPTGSYVAGGYCNKPTEEIVMDEVSRYGAVLLTTKEK